MRLTSLTARLTSVEAAYWSHERDKAWLRWVMPQDEQALLKAFARLHVARADSLGEGTRVGALDEQAASVDPFFDDEPFTPEPEQSRVTPIRTRRPVRNPIPSRVTGRDRVRCARWPSLFTGTLV